jgi:hypothetical protein
MLVREDDPPANEDFLFYLSRGSELLMQNRVVEAKEELEKALATRPSDAQGQDLLAGVYFRLGVYPTAIRLWLALVEEFPDDPILRVNLGLALFKTGQAEDAQVHLERALELDGDHERAWGYLGLTLWRLGKLDEAKQAFLRGGQLSMASRMEEESSAGTVPAPPPEPAVVAKTTDAAVSAMRTAAGEAERRLGASRVELSLEAPRITRPAGSWTVVETGADAIPRRSPSRPLLAISPPALSAMAEGWTVELPQDTPLAVGADGELLIRSDGAIHSRLSGLRAARGPLRTETVARRFRVRDTRDQSPLGGEDDPIARWHGPVAAVLAPPERLRYHALRIAGSLLYVREELVHAFDDRIGFESGRLPLAGSPALLLSFHGEGTVVLRLARRPSGLEVREGDEVHVDPNALCGWTGRLFPSEVSAPNPRNAPLAFRGQGIVLVT